MNTPRRLIHATLCAFFLICFPVYGMSSTTQVASEGRPISEEMAEQYGWPEGVLDLLNDPLRTDGWNSWFSGNPNDINEYKLRLRDHDDLELIIQKLTKIRADRFNIWLSPGDEPRSLMWGNELGEGNNIAAVFSIGSQKIKDQWFERLPVEEPGVRKFGVHRYTECPKARPPSLTLYVGHDLIDLDTLEIPLKIDLSAGVSDYYREHNEDNRELKAIDAFIAEHKSKQELALQPDTKPE